MKFKRFTKPGFLKQIGRKLLGRFFDRFKDGLAEKKIELPAGALKDDEYFKELSRVAMRPDGLPDDLFEAVYAIEEMATEEGQERLQRAAERGELSPWPSSGCTSAWLGRWTPKASRTRCCGPLPGTCRSTC